MSALEIRKVVGGIRCAVPGCHRSGRCEYYFIGLPTVINGRRELICEPCAKAWEKTFAELAPSRDRIETLIADIRGNATERCDAINDLREHGFSQDSVAQAVKWSAERVEPSEILDRMLGVVQVEAVA